VLLGLPACGLENAVDAWNAKPMEELSTGEASTSGVGESGGSSGGTGVVEGTGEAEGSSTGAAVPASTSTGADTHELSTGPASSSEGTGEPAGCGPQAECDDAKQANCFNCTRDRLVFVTSKSVRGDFAAEFGYDGLCNLLADEAGLVKDGVPHFKTWIATSTMDAVERLQHSSGRYVFINGEIFAENWDAIIAGDLKRALSFDEYGQEVNDLVWTDTMPDGRAVPDSSHCADWTSKGDELEASYGYSSDADGQWTHVIDGTSPALCGSSAALYCVESA